MAPIVRMSVALGTSSIKPQAAMANKVLVVGIDALRILEGNYEALKI